MTRALGRTLLEAAHRKLPSLLDRRWWRGKVLDWCRRDPAFLDALQGFLAVLPRLEGDEEIADYQRLLFREVEGRRLGGAAISVNKLDELAAWFTPGAEPTAVAARIESHRSAGLATTLRLLGRPDAELLRRRVETLGGPGIRFETDFPDDLEACLEAALAAEAHLSLRLGDPAQAPEQLARYLAVLRAPRFAAAPFFGLVLEAHRRDSGEQLRAVLEAARNDRSAPLQLTIVKGDGWRQLRQAAARRGWPSPVYLERSQTDRAFEVLVDAALAAAPAVQVVAGSHHVRALAAATASARHRKLDPALLELQLLEGMADPIAEALADLGPPVRILVPVGERAETLALLSERLVQSAESDAVLRQTFLDELDRERVISAPPSDVALGPAQATPRRQATDFRDGEQPPRFEGEPYAELHRPEVLQRYEEAEALLPSPRPAYRRIDGDRTPRDGDPAQAARSAREACERAAEQWRTVSADERARVLFAVADRLRGERPELTALLRAETGMSRTRGDAELCEAIDQLEFRGRTLLRLASGESIVRAQGVERRHGYDARGVFVIEGPTRAPIAGSAAVIASALATGNIPILLPPPNAESSTDRLVAAFFDGGLPLDCLAALPGVDNVEGVPRLRYQDGLSHRGSAVVHFDADLERAGAALAELIFDWGGQGQRSVGRVFAQARIHDALKVLLEAKSGDAEWTLEPYGSIEEVTRRTQQAPRAAVDYVWSANAYERIYLADAMTAPVVRINERPGPAPLPRLLAASIDDELRALLRPRGYSISS